MMDNTSDNQNGNSAQTQANIGATLRAARESQGLTVSDVAERIKFSVRQVEALEADDESHLPQGTFLRGFIRSYARYLHLDEATLLNPVPMQPVVVPLVEAEQAGGVAFRTSGSSGRKSAYLFAGAFLIAILLAFFVWSQRETTPVERTVIEVVKLPDLQVASMPVVTSSVAVTTIAVEPLAAVVAKENRPVEHSLALEKAKQVEPAKSVASAVQPTVAGKLVAPIKSVEPVATPAPVVKAKVVELPKVVVPATVAPLTVKPVLPVKAVQPPVVASTTPVKPIATTPTTTPTLSTPPPLPNNSDAELARLKKRPIHIVFSEETWMEIKDKNGELLLSRMNAAGSEKWIGGGQRTPYQVTVGKAKAVRLYYRGREVDLSKYNQTGLVHLVLE